MITFDSKIEIGNDYNTFFEEKVIKNEPMLFNCDGTHAYIMGGPITKIFLQRLQKEFGINKDDVVIDSRVHMSFKPGIYLCIPGYHHDDVPRTREDGQPNYYNPEYHAEHAMLLINGDIAPTEFAIGRAEFPDVPLGKKYYQEWHDRVEYYLNNGILQSVECPSNRIVRFNWQTWHQGTPTVKTGWRFFIRASWNTDRIKHVTNEIRRQVQVYLPLPTEGW